VLEDPKPLSPGTLIDGFTPDPNLSWIATYAGPCGDPECKEQHTRLYLIPIIGWLRVVIPLDGEDFDEVQLRPAVMASSGLVKDYFDLPDLFKFIAVLRVSDNTVIVARAIYQERYGTDLPIVVGESPSLPN